MATSKPLDVLVQRPLAQLVIDIRRDTSSVLNELLTAVDTYYQQGGDPIAALRRRRGAILAWHEDVAGPAPDGTTQVAKTRGGIVYAAHDDWEDGALKPGKQTLLAQYGDP